MTEDILPHSTTSVKGIRILPSQDPLRGIRIGLFHIAWPAGHVTQVDLLDRDVDLRAAYALLEAQRRHYQTEALALKAAGRGREAHLVATANDTLIRAWMALDGRLRAQRQERPS